MIITLENHIVDLNQAVAFDLTNRVVIMSDGHRFQANPQEAEEIKTHFYEKYVKRNIEMYEKAKPAVKKASKK